MCNVWARLGHAEISRPERRRSIRKRREKQWGLTRIFGGANAIPGGLKKVGFSLQFFWTFARLFG
jgi:hypothetical protein